MKAAPLASKVNFEFWGKLNLRACCLRHFGCLIGLLYRVKGVVCESRSCYVFLPGFVIFRGNVGLHFFMAYSLTAGALFYVCCASADTTAVFVYMPSTLCEKYKRSAPVYLSSWLPSTIYPTTDDWNPWCTEYYEFP